MFTLFGPDGRLLPDVRPFLEAIRDQPDEDTHRLVLADFLQERDDRRRGDENHAALIRFQCEHARTEPYTPRWFEQQARLRRLITALYGAPGFACPAHQKASYGRFVRGFPTAVCVHAASHLRGTDPAFALGTLDTLAVGCARSARALIRQPQVGRVAALELEQLSPGGLARLIDEGDVARVRRWQVGRGGPADGEVNALWAAVARGRLGVEELDLRWHWQLSDDSVEALAEIASRMREGRLRLHGTLVAGAVLRGLVQRPAGQDRGIRELVLDHAVGPPHAVGDAHLRELARWPGARHLEVLSVVPVPGARWLTDRGVEALAGSSHLCRLRALCLEHARVTDRGATALARCPAGWDLRWVRLRGTGVTPAGAAALRDRFPDCRIDLDASPERLRA